MRQCGLTRGLGLVRTREVVYWFPAEPATQHQVNVRVRNFREIRMRHFYVFVVQPQNFETGGVSVQTEGGLRKRHQSGIGELGSIHEFIYANCHQL